MNSPLESLLFLLVGVWYSCGTDDGGGLPQPQFSHRDMLMLFDDLSTPSQTPFTPFYSKPPAQEHWHLRRGTDWQHRHLAPERQQGRRVRPGRSEIDHLTDCNGAEFAVKFSQRCGRHEVHSTRAFPVESRAWDARFCLVAVVLAILLVDNERRVPCNVLITVLFSPSSAVCNDHCSHKFGND